MYASERAFSSKYAMHQSLPLENLEVRVPAGCSACVCVRVCA